MSAAFLNAARDIRQVLSRMSENITDQDRSTAIAIGVGRALSLTLTIPSSPVENMHGHYSTTHEPQIEVLLSKLNEAFIIDVRLCLELTYQFYKFRYDLVHDPMILTNLLPKLAHASTDYFSKDVCDVMTKELSADDDCWYFNTWQNLVRGLVNAVGEDAETSTVEYQQGINLATMA
jgi:hypothetical protein